MAQIVGVFRIGRDAEVRYTQNNDAVASLSLAANYGQKDQQTGNRPTQWIDASLWGKRAEAMAPYLTKGTMIYAVIGDPHIETFQGKNGEGHKLAGRVIEIEFAGGGQRQEAQQPQQRQQAPQQNRTAQPRQAPQSFDDMDSDIPFN